ncbi:MAG: ATP-binding cassette domain-containing protein [Actinobacteria bacterium]|nr:ATP-binding cassette domain-containing protein [Actinomycetota bacterium]
MSADGAMSLSLECVSCCFGPTVALAPLTLRMSPGTVCLVTGANGSGKTSLLRVAAGVTRPTTGSRRVPGMAVYLRSGDGARAFQTPRQAIRFVGGMRDSPGSVEEALALLGLSDIADRRVRELSAGQRARVTLAVALVCRPALACLDEPTAHLDAEGSVLAGEVLSRLVGDGAAVLVATHDDRVLGKVADSRVHLRDGVLQAAPW